MSKEQGGLAFAVGFNEDQLDPFRLHLGDQVTDMRGGRRNAGLGLDGIDYTKTESIGKITKGFVIGDDVRSLERRHLLLPDHQPAINLLLELLHVRLEDAAVIRDQQAKTLRQKLCNQ